MRKKIYSLLLTSSLIVCKFYNSMVNVFANEITAYGYRDEYIASINYDSKSLVETTRPAPCGQDAIGILKLAGNINKPLVTPAEGYQSYTVTKQ